MKPCIRALVTVSFCRRHGASGQRITPRGSFTLIASSGASLQASRRHVSAERRTPIPLSGAPLSGRVMADRVAWTTDTNHAVAAMGRSNSTKGRMMMKTANMILRLTLAAILCALCATAYAQEKPYTEGSIWSISMIRVKPGMLDVYMREVLPLRKKINEEAKKDREST